MIAQGNVSHLLVGKDLDIAADTVSRGSLTTGQIGIFLVGNVLANGAGVLAAGTRYTIATKNQKGVVIETPVLTKGKESSLVATNYVAATSASKAIGFNGTSGSIAVVNSNDYVAHIFWKDNSKTFGYGQPVKFAAYRSSTAATQVEIASGLALNFNKNFSRENPKIMKAEILINSAGTAVPTGADTIAFTNGSKYFTATDIDNATGTSAMAVGDYIRIGSATTHPCYKIVAIDTTNNIGTLEMPFQGASISGLDTTYELVVAATAAAAAAGVKLSALDSQQYFEPGVVKYDFLVFSVDLKEAFGATTLTDLTSGTKGNGVYYDIAQTEWFLKGNRGETWRLGNYPKNVALEATSGKTYNQITIGFAETPSKTINGPVSTYGTVMIATEYPSTGAVYANLKTALGL